ncbi:hypothetical protein Tco_0856953 [Tanacetum coccineum]|uniref:PB1-like domain-containing protein n=1 Tax=Tanacetum coccineum TaxID=301880 RepID=A0ABQ5B5K7_9ASTR
MENKNPIRTLGDYSRPSHEGYRNTIELPDGSNVVPLRSGTIRLVQNICSFHELRSEDPNQHLKDFLKLVDSLDLNVANRERTRMRKSSLLIYHGGSFRKFPNHDYLGGKIDMFDFVDIDYFSVHELDVMVLQLRYNGADEPMYYHYLKPMTDLDVGLLGLGLDEDVHSLSSLICNFKVIEVLIEHGITKLDCYNMSNFQIRATIEEHQEDTDVEESSASPK